MGNQQSGGQRKYVLPQGSSVVNDSQQEEGITAVGGRDCVPSVRKFFPQCEKDTSGSAKSKSKLHKSISLIPGKSSSGKQRKKSSDFDTPTKNSKKQAQRHQSVPLSGSSSNSKGTVNTNNSSGNQILLASQKMNCSLEKFAKHLAQLSVPGKSPGQNGNISRSVFLAHVVRQSPIASAYLWNFFCSHTDSETINEATFIRSAEQFYTPITDKAQVNFYVKLFGNGSSEVVERSAFIDFFLSAFQLSTDAPNEFSKISDSSEEFEGKEWLESVARSCFHIKSEMSQCYITNWIFSNTPRIVLSMHKYILHQLSTGYAQIAVGIHSDESPRASSLSSPTGISLMEEYRLLKESKLHENEATILDTADHAEPRAAGGSHDKNPLLLWLLSLCLPSTYTSVMEKKPDQVLRPNSSLNPKQLLMTLMSQNGGADKWNMLYHSDDHGLSINRIQFHVFNYRGPTLMFVKAENNYILCVAVDVEWKESCHFWGGEDAMLIQLQPEFRIVDKGAKIIYTNFSIRGYPFGIQIGKDPKNVSVEIKPDFEYVSFKKIPCRILNIEVWGCAPSQEKRAQVEFKKWEAKESEKQRKINLNSVDWNDNPDKYLLELGGAYRSYGNKQ